MLIDIETYFPFLRCHVSFVCGRRGWVTRGSGGFVSGCSWNGLGYTAAGEIQPKADHRPLEFVINEAFSLEPQECMLITVST